jgi:hypothetical protein
VNKLKLTQEIEILTRAIQKEQAAYDEAVKKNDTTENRQQIDMRIKQLNEQLDDLYQEMEEIEEREPSSGGE